MDDRPDRRATIALVVILLVAAALRLIGLDWGLPYDDFHPDERLLQDTAEHVRLDHLNPHLYVYPTFFIYQLAIVQRATAALGDDSGDRLFGGRLLTALYGWLTVLLLYGLGTRLAGRRVGLVAAGVHAVSGVSLLHAHYAVTDTPMTTLATATLYLGVRAWQRRSIAGVLLAAAVAGLAVSTKYNALPVLFVPLLAAFVLLARQQRSLPLSLTVALAVPAIGLLSFFLASPYTLLDYQAWFHDLGDERELQASGRPGWHVEGPDDLHWSDHGVVGNATTMLEDLGPVVLGLTLAGLSVGVAGFFRGGRGNGDPARRLDTPAGRWDSMGWALIAPWPLLYYVEMAPSAIWGSRYIMPIYPALILFAAGALELALRKLPRRLGAVPRVGAQAVLVAAVAAVPAWEGAQAVTLVATPDTRLFARQWMIDNLPPGSRIAREFYAPPLHTGDGFQLVQFFALSDHTLELYCERRVEYLVTSSRNYNRYFEDDSERFRDERGWYESLERRAHLVKRFPGVEREFHHPTIQIWRLFCPGR